MVYLNKGTYCDRITTKARFKWGVYGEKTFDIVFQPKNKQYMYIVIIKIQDGCQCTQWHILIYKQSIT